MIRWRTINPGYTLLMVVILLAAPVPGVAADPFDSDPLGLIAYHDRQKSLGVGEDSFELWLCEGTPSAEDFIEYMETEINPYFGMAVRWSI